MFRAPLRHGATQTHCPHGTATSRTSRRQDLPTHRKRFVRDLLRNSHVKVCKASVSCETSSKRQAETPIGAHITQPCQAVSRSQPLQTTPGHTPIPMSQRHSPVPQLTTSRFHAPATKLSASTRLTRTKYCACREICHLRHTSQLHDSLRLPSSEHTPIHQNRHLS